MSVIDLNKHHDELNFIYYVNTTTINGQFCNLFSTGVFEATLGNHFWMESPGQKFKLDETLIGTIIQKLKVRRSEIKWFKQAAIKQHPT